MTPVQDLLHRIHGAPEFGRATFEIGCVDRVAAGTARVAFRKVLLGADSRLVVQNAFEDNGSPATIPLHRVREVWRDGRLIWERAQLRT